LAGQTGQVANSIVLNASGAVQNAANAGFYVNPVRTAAAGVSALTLAVSSNEIVINSSKTFVIDHPCKPATHYLIHACLEGPEAGVYYRGCAEIPAGATEITVNLPEYIDKLATEFTVSLTNSNHFVLALATHVTGNQFQIQIEAPAGRALGFYWHVMGKRHPIRDEILKKDAIVRGDGPYRWLGSNNPDE